MENSPLISKLLEVNEYKDLYHAYLNNLVLNYIRSDKYEATINKLNNLIGPYIKNDATAFYTYEEYSNSLPHLIKFGKDRAKSITAQLAGQQPSTTYGTLESTVDFTALGSMSGMDKPGDRGERNGNRHDIVNMPPRIGTENLDIMPQFLILSASIISILVGLLFVFKFKRRKYIS